MKELPKGLRIDRGYLQIRLFNDGKSYYENFGLDSEVARELATTKLNDLRKHLLLWKHKLIENHPFEREVKIETKKFRDVANIYFSRWSEERDPEGMPKHTEKAKTTCRYVIDGTLLPFFGSMEYDSIKPSDVKEWRTNRLKSVLGTTANREQNVLSSIFSHIETWVKTEQIKPFKLPIDPQTKQVCNPCEHIEKASNRKRERVLSTQELKILKEACSATNDTDLWEICKMALKSLLRKKDLMRLENGEDIDLTQAKTRVRIQLPVQVLRPLNYVNFRKRWEAIRKAASLLDCQFRDLRKTGANLLKLKNHSNKLISEFLGHTNTETTELYLIKNSDHLKPLAEDLEHIVESI